MGPKTEIRILGLKVYEKRSDSVRGAIRENWLFNIFGSTTATGKQVNEKNSETIAVIWACKQLLSNTFAMVPLNAYLKNGDSRSILENDPVHYLIHNRPNSYMTSFTWRRTIMMQAATHGNSYTLIHRNNNTGKPEWFELIQNPKDVTPYLIKGIVWYAIRGVEEPVNGENIIHFKWNGNGISGKSPLEIARENIGQALAIQDYGSKVFSAGGSKKIALKTAQKFNDEQKASFRKFWEDQHGGTENLHNLAFLDGGSDLVEIGMNPEEAQMVEILKFKIEEICRIYNVPLHLVQSLDHATNNNIEHQGIQFVTYTMMPHFKNFEEELDFKLFPLNPNKYTRHNTNALMRGDMAAEAQYFRTMTDIGIYSINDVKRIKDENPIPEGDGHYVQLNRISVEKMNNATDQTLRMLANEAMVNAKRNVIETRNMKHVNSTPEKRVFDVAVNLEKRADGSKSRKVIIRAAVIDSLSKPLGWGFKERIEAGAFDGADMSDVVAVLNHDFNILYARTASKTLVLTTDESGLTAEFDAPETSHGNDLLVMIERGDISQASFQFVIDKDRWVNDPDEGEVRIIEKFRKIIDVSPVVFPAYADTDVAKRSHDTDKEEQESKIPASVLHAEAELELIKIKSFN